MQRFHRLGSVGLTLVITAFTFHLVAISYDRWTISSCRTCYYKYYFREFRTSINQRCYRISILNYLKLTSNINSIMTDPFTSYVCVPNKYLFAKESGDEAHCLGDGTVGPHNACTSENFNNGLCQCDYTKSTKAVLSLSIISSVLLGLMVIISHFASYVQHDFILRWLVPGGFGALMISFIAIFANVLITAGNKDEDVDQIVRWRQLELSTGANASFANDTSWWAETSADSYDISYGFSFGMEIIAGHLTLVSAIVYALMFLGKKRPNA